MSPELSHLDAHGRAFMVDVTGKPFTEREARVRCVVANAPRTVALLGGAGPLLAIREPADVRTRGDLERLGDDVLASNEYAPSHAAHEVLEGARMAGLGAAKATSEIIPLCHPLPLSDLDVAFALRPDAIEVYSYAATKAQTGVEMEALTACALAAITVMMTALANDPLASVEELTLWEKRGGRTGHWQRRADGGVERLLDELAPGDGPLDG